MPFPFKKERLFFDKIFLLISSCPLSLCFSILSRIFFRPLCFVDNGFVFHGFMVMKGLLLLGNIYGMAAAGYSHSKNK